MKIVLADAVAEECARVLEEKGLQPQRLAGAPRAELEAALADAAGLVVRSATQVDSEVMALAPRLQVVGRAGSGVDNIDVAAATERGILVMNAPGENTLSAAEHALALLMALCRNIPAADQRMRTGEWSKKGLMGVELHGKTLGVVGMGRIGREVASRARAFGMRVLAFDPFLPPEVAERMEVELVELDELWPQADFLSLHAPLSDRTRHILNAESLQRCKPGVRIVNCARGGILDEAALLEALESGQVAGAALDVFEQEPLPQDHALRKHPKVVVTPHLGASTSEAQEKVAVRIAEQIADYLNQGVVRNAVNMVSVEPAVAERLAPYQRLAENMGALHAHLLNGRYVELQVEVAGDIQELPVRPLTSAVLKGLLGQLLSQSINLVNAESVAQAQGYPYTELRSQDTDGYAGLMTVRLRSDQGEHLLAGTVFGHRFPKLVRVDDYFVETALKGEMLFCSNDDRPGRLASMTAAVAENGVNIANLALGRQRQTGKALATFNLDSPLPEEGLEQLRAVDGVHQVYAVSFPLS